MSLAFLSPAAAAAVARSPMARCAEADGARCQPADGWMVAVDYGPDPEAERRTAAHTAGWADVSHLTKLELQGPLAEVAALAGVELALGTATRHDDAWWCPLTPTRALVIASARGAADRRERLSVDAERASARIDVADVTTTFAALTLVGPLAREVLARFSALDLRDTVAAVGALRPGSVARQPAILIRESEQRYLILFGAATAEYVWSVVADAGRHLGGRAIGVRALASWEGQDA